MNFKNLIIKIINEKGFVNSADLVKISGLSRQAVHKHLKKFVNEGIIKKLGNTKGVKYILNHNNTSNIIINFARNYNLKNLKEDVVFDEIAIQSDLKHQINKNVYNILLYTFTEILNNAIDHSNSVKSQIYFKIDNYNIYFKVEDWGIGIFENIKSKFNLNSEYEALQELIKGKITTFKERHSGEGLFFSSKIADKIIIKSHNIELVFDNNKKDVFTRETKYKKGTMVEFFIKKKSKRKLETIFEKYSGEEFDYKFEKTTVTVNLFIKEKNYYASRSEAKRLLHNLIKFKKIILNFNGVKGIGQGFADEIFRVFNNKHPEIIINPINMNKAVETMIKHVS